MTGKGKEISIGPEEVTAAHLAVLTALIEELRASKSIDGPRLADRIEDYASRMGETSSTIGFQQMIQFFAHQSRFPHPKKGE